MSTDELIRKLKPLLDEWPLGGCVWHRACGRRGVLMGVTVLLDGEVSFRIDYGAGGWASEKPAAMSAKKIGDGTEGDEWKDPDATGGTAQRE